MRKINSICVYCGTGSEVDPSFKDGAERFGRILAKDGVRLVYGGGRIGLMGILASAVFMNGGEVIGIIPEFIQDKEIRNTDVTELLVVDSMHTRKRMMMERSDAFVILPGGIGTLDETFEILTWKYMGLHDKPVVFMNTLNYYTPLMGMIDHMVKSGFTPFWQRSLFQMVDAPEDIMPVLRSQIEHIPTDIEHL
ncbi:MAG: TIGR00730 family Rossman fold protein [Pseudomonadota bacterium]